MATVLDAALAYLRAGLSVIPIARDGSKRPLLKWTAYQQKHLGPEEAESWWGVPSPPGIAAIGGRISGNLECLDFDLDAEANFAAWCDLVSAEEPDLLHTLPQIQTPKSGRHVWYRCNGPVCGNLKLAWDETGKEITIETRGEGGYALVPGCPADCHEFRRLYKRIVGPPLSEVPAVTVEQRELFLRCARSLCKKPVAQSSAPSGLDLKPGDDFDVRGSDWAEILTGWTLCREVDGVRYWRRPGKDAEGWSATTGRCRGKKGEELLRVFSSNAHPFEEGRAYGKFRALALLRHSGDLSVCAKELARQAYGNGRVPAKPRPQAAPSQDATWESPLPPGPPPFPLDVLPCVAAEFALAAAESIGCPVDYVAVPMLGAASVAVGASFALSLKRTWVERGALYLAVVGDPGTAKSPGLDLSMHPVTHAQHRMERTWDDAVNKYESDLARHEAQTRRRKKADSDDEEELPPRPQAPALQRTYTTDSTVEALAPVLADNPRGLGMVMDELSAWVMGLNQYKGGKGADRQFYLKAWSGASIVVDRKGNAAKRPIQIRRPFLTVVGGIQPDMLSQLGDERCREDGFLHRILFAWPVSAEAPKWSDAEIHEDLESGWASLLGTLSKAEMIDSEGGPRSWLVHLDAEARDLWIAAYDEFGRQMDDEGPEGTFRGPLAKLRAYVARLSLILSRLRLADENRDLRLTVAHSDVRGGGLLAEYFLAHARRVYARLGSTAEDARASRLLAWIKKAGGEATARMLCRAEVCGLKRAGDAEQALRDLADRGMGRLEERIPPSGGHAGLWFVAHSTLPDTRHSTIQETQSK